MPENALFDHITLVLHQPRFAENIGASARAAWNMGLSHIIVVNPEDTDWERMTKLSTHMARGLLEKMETYSSLAEALAPFQYIVGTTARLGGQRKEIIGPSQAARKIRSLDRQNRIAVLFGPENRGLNNEELRFCHCTVHIPTVSASSLNLGQAVLILCYEILMAHQEIPVHRSSFVVENSPGLDLESSPHSSIDQHSFEYAQEKNAERRTLLPIAGAELASPVPGHPSPETFEPSSLDSSNSAIPCRSQDPQSEISSASSNSEIRNPKSAIPLASSFELEGMYRHLSEVLQLMDFLDKQNPEVRMMSLRRFFSRTGLQSNEVRLIRGVCRQLKWFITRYRPQSEHLRIPASED